MPIFSLASEVDKEHFDQMKKNLILQGVANPNLSEAEVAAWGRQAGTQFTASYFRRASDESLIEYSAAYMAFFDRLAKQNPEAFCKWQLPDVFGFLQPEEIQRISGIQELFKHLKVTITSGAKNEYSGQNRIGSVYLDSFRKNFAKHNLRILQVIDNPQKYRTAAGFPVFAQAMLKFYSELNQLPKIERASIWRYMLGGTE